MPDPERLHINLNPKAAEALRDAMELESSTSKTDTVIRAIQAYAWLLEQKTLGAEILVHQSDGTAGRVHFL